MTERVGVVLLDMTMPGLSGEETLRCNCTESVRTCA